MKKEHNSAAASLRQKAEELHKQGKLKKSSSLSEADINKLIHELEVHQIELELQNEELILAKEQAEVATDRYTVLYDFAPSGYFTLSKEGIIIELNLLGAKMLGNDRSYLINKRFGLFITDDSKAIYNQFLWNIFKSKKNESCEITITVDTIESYFYITAIVDQKNEECFLTMVDITERKQNEKALIQSNYLNLSLLHTIPFGIDIVDEDGTILYQNDNFRNIFNKSVVGCKCWTTYRDDKTQCNNCPLITGFNEGQTETIEVAGVLGGKIFEIIHTGMMYKGKKAILEIFHDITERKLSEAIFKDIIEKNPMSIQILNMEGCEIQANSAHNNLFGVKPPTTYSIFKDKQLLEQGFEELFEQIKKGEVVYFPDSYYNVRDVDPTFPDRPIWIKAIGFTLNNNNGTPEKIVIIHEDITESKHSKALLNDIIEKNPISIQIVDKDGCTLKVNPSFTKLFGAIPPAGFSIFEDLEEKGFKDLIQRVKEGEVIQFPDVFYNIHDTNPELPDTPVWIRAILFPLKDNYGKPEHFIFMHENITERKQNEKALLLSEKKYKYLVWDMQVGLLIQGPKAEILLSNNKALELLGITEDQLLGKTSFDPDWNVIHEDGSPFPGDTHPVPQAIAIRKSVENVIMGVYRPSIGDRIWLLVSAEPQLHDDGTIEQVVCSFIDITELKKAEKELIKAKEKAEESDRKYKLIFNSTDTANSIFDNNCNLIIQNKISQEFLGVGENEGIGKSVFEIFGQQAGKAVYERMNRVLNTGTPEMFETEFDLITGKNWFRSTYYPILDENKKVNSVQVISQNITEIKKAQLELITAKEKAEESDRLKSAFLANMSHEIRTPMNGILGFADLLKEPMLSGDQQKHYISIIERSGRRMLNLINDIITISKIEAGSKDVVISEINVNEIMEYIYTFFTPETEKKGILLSNKKTSTDKALIFNTDKEKLYGILTNLVKNAIKFTDIGSIEMGYSILSSSSEPNVLKFYVKDTGIGVPKDRQEAIFERFIQADIESKQARQGAGLGLSIAKAYIEQLEGEIWLESEEGVGSTFYFTIPDNKPKEEPIANDAIHGIIELNQLKKLKILIAEDDEISAFLIQKSIKNISREILKARTGYDAVEICKTNPDIDLILMDIKMPNINGFEATALIRQFNEDVIIIAQTAFALYGDEEKAIDMGCNDYITKPIDMSLLMAKINKHFKKQS